MKTIAASDAKARFSQLISDVERGEIVDITRHGKIVARLSRPESDDTAQRAAAVERIRGFIAAKSGSKTSVDEILAMRDAGRR